MTSADDETANDGRIPLADAPRRHRRDTRLEPAIDAELSWGNPVVRDFTREPKLDDATMTFAHPLHVARMLDTFRFPPDAGPGEGGGSGQTSLSDAQDWTVITGGLRPGFRLVTGDRRGRTEPIPGYHEPATAPRRPPTVSEPSWPGRAGVPGAALGWPAGPIVPTHLWLDDGGRPTVETVGDTDFVVATTAAEPAPTGVVRPTTATYVEDLDALLAMVPDGVGVRFDGGTTAGRAVRPGQLEALRPREAPAPGDPRVHLSPVPDFLLDEVRRIGRALDKAGLHARAIWASTPEASGLWVDAVRTKDADAAWAVIRETRPWPATRYVTRAEHTRSWGSVPRPQDFIRVADLPDERLRPAPAGRSRPPPGCAPVIAVLVVLCLVLLVLDVVLELV